MFAKCNGESGLLWRVRNHHAATFIVASLCLLFAIFALNREKPAARSACEADMKTVKLDVAGMHLNIPLGYFYIDGYVKHGKWPNPSHQRVPVESVNIDFLLPDLRGLSCQEMESVSTAQPAFPYISAVFRIARPETRDWYKNVLKRISDGKLVEDGYRDSLRRYREGRTFYYLDKDKQNFMITCRNNANKTTCLVKDLYMNDFYLEYFASEVGIFNNQMSVVRGIRQRVEQFRRDALAGQ